MNPSFNLKPQIKILFDTSKLPDINETSSPKVVRKGFRARKGEVTEALETNKMVTGLRKHWISCGTVF